jgi:hypothetical protein
MRTGDRVRLTKLPLDLPEGEGKLKTQATFEKCLGREFFIQGFQQVTGFSQVLVELEVGSVTANKCETIWVEPEYLERLPGKVRNDPR